LYHPPVGGVNPDKMGDETTVRRDRDMLNADQMLAKLYALRKDYADDPEDDTFQALHHAFLFISYNVGAFKKYVEEQNAKAGGADLSPGSE
jgi:hypothetical protein